MGGVTCIGCAGFRLRDAGVVLAAEGFGCCEHREKFIVFGAHRERNCLRFAAADRKTVAERGVWLDSVRKPRKTCGTGATRH